MALNIRNTEAEQLVERIAEITGETKTSAVIKALRERHERLRREHSGRSLADRLDEIAQHSATLPVRDSRSIDQIIGYDEDGLPS